MPHGDPDPTDPMALAGVEFAADEEDVVCMACAFADEFAASGWDEPRLLWMFKNPYYAGPHLAYRQLGEDRIRTIIGEAVAPWRNNDAQG